MRSILLVHRATILLVLPRVFVGTMAPGLASVPSVKVSLIGSMWFVEQDIAIVGL